MALGYAPELVKKLNTALKNPENQNKVDPMGFAKAVIAGNKAEPIRVTAEDTGGLRTHNFWTRQRATVSMTDTAYSCDNVLTPARKQESVSTPKTRQIAWMLPDALITNYEGISTTGATLGGKSVSSEWLDILYSSANALYEGLNLDLQSLITWGNNMTVTAGPKNAAQTINIPTASTTMVLGNGISRINADVVKNGFSGRYNMVGLGLGFDYAMYAKLSSAANQSGFDNRIATATYDFFADMIWESASGGGAGVANSVGVFEQGSMQLVEYMETDFRKGELANSFFFPVTIPQVDSLGNAFAVRMDAQLKEIDCPTTLTDAYTGNTATYTRGTALILWKNFGLYQPTALNNFRSEDRLQGVNGALRYTLTNS